MALLNFFERIGIICTAPKNPTFLFCFFINPCDVGYQVMSVKNNQAEIMTVMP